MWENTKTVAFFVITGIVFLMAMIFFPITIAVEGTGWWKDHRRALKRKPILATEME